MKKKVIKKKSVEQMIENLANMTAKGFSEQSKDLSHFKSEMHDFKDEMHDFKTKTERILYSIDGKLQIVDKRLDSIEKVLGPLVHVADALKREYRDHELRISKLEQRVGMYK